MSAGPQQSAGLDSTRGVHTPPLFENRICYWLTEEV